MTMFSSDFCIAHSGNDAKEFLTEVLATVPKVLFIGTVGLEASSLYFSQLLATSKNVDFRFLVEKRPAVQSNLERLGLSHRAHLSQIIAPENMEFVDVEVVAADNATVAGRNAVSAAAGWLARDYSHIVVDATGMSRGTCFPVVRQALAIANRTGVNVHVVVAANKRPTLTLKAQVSDRADWIHGFQASMGTDRSEDVFKLWVPQLSEGTSRALDLMGRTIQDLAEVCPILPFPSYNPKRGDQLLAEHAGPLRDQWETDTRNLIYAHETDPLDVFRSVSRLHLARKKIFDSETRQSTTILSPNGWRVGSIGLFLAAVEHNLPMLYVETVGYSCVGPISEEISITEPDLNWHLWLAGEPYRNGFIKQ